jgi:ABC-2 type transport system permease protein
MALRCFEWVCQKAGKVSEQPSIIPFTAPFSMPGRLLTADVPFWKIGLSVLLLVLTIVLFIHISVKLYSSAVLHYGKRLKISELAKMSKNT